MSQPGGTPAGRPATGRGRADSPGLALLRAQVRRALAEEPGLAWEPWSARRLEAGATRGSAPRGGSGAPATPTTARATAVPVVAPAGGVDLPTLPTQRPGPDAEPEDARERADAAPAEAHDVTDGVAGPAAHAAPEGEQAEVMALVVRAQEGDGPAFGELYDRYVDLVFRYIHYRVGDRALAEDLTSETFLRALKRIGSFTWQGRDVGAWFVTIARNLIADHYKSSRYRLEVSTADMLDADRATDGPEGEVLDALANAALVEAVRRLNPEQQECVVLRFLQGLSVAETALAMGRNEGAIKALQYRAVRTLGRLLPAEAVR